MEKDIRQEIMDAAKALFLEKGYKETKVMDIAEALKISPSTIYKYFSGKKELFDALDIEKAALLSPKHDAKRQEIIDTALLLFGAKGFEATSMNMIAKKLGLSKAAIYQYFENKDDLFAAVMQETPFYHNFISIKPDLKTDDVYSAIYRVGEAYTSMLSAPERKAFTRTILRDSDKHPEVSEMFYKNGIGYVMHCVVDILEKYKGELNPEIDLSLAAENYVGSLFAYIVVHKIVGVRNDHSDQDYIKNATDILMKAIIRR